jgi:hypothetical protein
MKELFKQPSVWAALLLVSPLLYILLYRLGLELWCIAYGLIY